jgi:hypothetical protein
MICLGREPGPPNGWLPGGPGHGVLRVCCTRFYQLLRNRDLTRSDSGIFRASRGVDYSDPGNDLDPGLVHRLEPLSLLLGSWYGMARMV